MKFVEDFKELAFKEGLEYQKDEVYLMKQQIKELKEDDADYEAELTEKDLEKLESSYVARAYMKGFLRGLYYEREKCLELNELYTGILNLRNKTQSQE